MNKSFLIVGLFILITVTALAETPGIKFVLNAAGTGYTVMRNSNVSGEIIIPATYNGKPVVEIGKDAFKGCNKIISITIPNSVTAIGAVAFSGCTGLTGITIPDSVTRIG